MSRHRGSSRPPLVHGKEPDEVTHMLSPEAPAVRDCALRVCHFGGEAEVAGRGYKWSRGVLDVNDIMLDTEGGVALHNLRAASVISPRMR